MPTKQEIESAIKVAKAALETIVDSGPDGMPSGPLYAAMMSVFASVDTYDSLIGMLIRSKLITRDDNHVLKATV